MLLKNKVVLVSGMSPGMGIKLAVESAREGAAAIIVAARSPSKLDDAELAVSAEGYTTPVLKTVCGIRDRAMYDAVASQGVARFGRIDSLVNKGFVHGTGWLPQRLT